MKNIKLKLKSETIRFLTQREMRAANGGGVCSTGTTISEERCNPSGGCGGGNTGMLCQTHEYPCTVAPF